MFIKLLVSYKITYMYNKYGIYYIEKRTGLASRRNKAKVIKSMYYETHNTEVCLRKLMNI